jgi:3,4-dihydroxy 2-butanone 4-phosphate synthase/GTP cyclohydrolase II
MTTNKDGATVAAEDDSPHTSTKDLMARLDEYARSSRLYTEGAGLEHPVVGTTLFLARTKVPTRFGDFQAYIFQDLIHKGYVIALVYGDVKSNDAPLVTRMHSSCVTSETLGGADCDCVQQLEGAMAAIAKNERGVLFYLLQEGRGAGYCGKARDRMLVQASGEQISTFEAYGLLGMKKDYRDYQNVADIINILAIDTDWVLLTNNPDKVEAMKRHGLRVVRHEPLEFDAGPFNRFYLESKRASGHTLERTGELSLPQILPPENPEPFKPRRLPEAERFVYMASYFLPIRPIGHEIVIPYSSLESFMGGERIEHYMTGNVPAIQSYEAIRGNRLALILNPSGLNELRKTKPSHPLLGLEYVPYWFRVHVYFDVVTGDDLVVLTYGKPESFESPIVRVQSESILNRFPVKVDANKTKYQLAVRKIVRYGAGAIVLVYQDGRGSGFGAFAMDRMLMEEGRARSTEESYRKLGIPFDQRDYRCVFDVLKSHLPGRSIQMVMNSPNSMVQKSEYAQALHESGLNVTGWIFLESEM